MLKTVLWWALDPIDLMTTRTNPLSAPATGQAIQDDPELAFKILAMKVGATSAALLRRAGIASLDELRAHIQAAGPGTPWHASIAGLGKVKAKAIEASLDAPDPPSTWMVPLERMRLPAHIDGRQGRFRAPSQACLLDADDDLRAVQAWLANHKAQPHTWRAYRKEAERFLLWAAFALGKPLSSVTHEDAVAYRDFLMDPQPADQWCAPRNAQRWSPKWRPFEGPLSHAAVHQAVVTLHALFKFLVDKSYLVGNAFSGVKSPRTGSAEKRFQRRALSQKELDFVRGQIDTQTKSGRRLRALIELLYATGLRLSAVAHARWDNIERVEQESGVYDWWLHTVGKRGKEHQVPVYEDVLQMLEVHGLDRALSYPPRKGWGRAALIGRVTDPGGDVEAAPRLSDECLREQYLAEILKAHFQLCAAKAREAGKEEVARKLERASTHWMRHTHATHALKAGANIEVVQAQLAHASVATTGLYLTTENEERANAMRAFWEKKKLKDQ